MTTADDLRRREFRHILLLKPTSLGDVLHTLPVLVKLRARYPTARIDWLLTSPLAELIGRHPALSNVVPFRHEDFGRAWKSWRHAARLGRLLWTVRRTRYDLVIDLYGRRRSALIALASGAAVRIGFDRPRRWTIQNSSGARPAAAYRNGWTGAREGSWRACTHHIPLPTLDMHALDRYLLLGPMLGLDARPPDLRVPIPAEAEDCVESLLREHGLTSAPFAVLVPGTTWSTKHWPAAHFSEVGRRLISEGRHVVVAGTEAERRLCQEVADDCPGAVTLAGQTTLSELAALLRRAVLCVANDSGAMHLAVAVGSPIVGVFGPTEPLWVGPYGRSRAAVRAGLACSPCYLHDVTACPHGHACLREVTASAVLARAAEFSV